MMLFERLGELVALLEAHVKYLDDTESFKKLNSAVDADAVYLWTEFSNSPDKERLVMLFEYLEDCFSRCCRAQTVLL